MTYYERMIHALAEGLLLLIKYGLLIAAIIYAYVFAMQTRQMAINGEQAAIAILEYQKNDILPKFPLPDSSHKNDQPKR